MFLKANFLTVGSLLYSVTRNVYAFKLGLCSLPGSLYLLGVLMLSLSLAVNFPAWFLVQLEQDCSNVAIRSNRVRNADATLFSQHFHAHLISKLFARWSAKALWKMDCECFWM